MQQFRGNCSIEESVNYYIQYMAKILSSKGLKLTEK